MFPSSVSGGAIFSRLVMVVPGIFLYNDLRVVITEMVDSFVAGFFFLCVNVLCCCTEFSKCPSF